MIEYIHVDTTDPLEAYEFGLDEPTPEALSAPTAKEQDIADHLAGLMLDWSARDVALSTCDLVVLTAWRHAGWEAAVSTVAWTLVTPHLPITTVYRLCNVDGSDMNAKLLRLRGAPVTVTAG